MDGTCVLWGTAWTSRTLLARTIRVLREAEGRDQVRRVFLVPWEQVAAESPAYGRYVRGEIERLGRNHPLIRTQYDLEEIDEEGGMFSPATRVLMRGTHERQRGPIEGREYALLVDVAGEAEERDEQSLLRDEPSRRDSTALTVVEVTRDFLGQPSFLVMDRYHWTGTAHHALYGAITHLADLWGAAHVVVDATGVGAGLASFLKRALGERVQPFVFTARSKSDLGWAFLGICNSGRFYDYRDDGGPEQRQFWREVEAADYVVVDGPGRLMRWGVEDPTVHDDLLISAALCAALEGCVGGHHLTSQVIDARDSLWSGEEEGSADGE
ncbi:MAG: phage terminase large subunit family protein [Anaerolineae bacterium]